MYPNVIFLIKLTPGKLTSVPTPLTLYPPESTRTHVQDQKGNP